MLIASKYEEIYHPTVEDFVYITDNSYTAEEVRSMERLILRSVGYSLASPAPITFLRRLSKFADRCTTSTPCMESLYIAFYLQGDPNWPKHTSKQQHECPPAVRAAAVPTGNEREPQSNTPQHDCASKEAGSARPAPQPMEVREVACELQRKLRFAEDVDEGDRGNIALCADYVKVMYQYLQRLEKVSGLVCTYMYMYIIT